MGKKDEQEENKNGDEQEEIEKNENGDKQKKKVKRRERIT